MHRGSHDVGLSCVLCFFMQSWNSFITCTRTRLSDARITRSHATQLPQRPSTRVLSPAHLGARSEVSVRLKRQAVFHGPVLFLAARPPDHAVHDLPAPGRARLAASRPGSAPRVGRLTHILVFKRPGHVALSKNPARTTAEPCQRGSSKRFILVKVFLNCPTRLCGKRQGDSIAHRFESEIHGDSLGYGA